MNTVSLSKSDFLTLVSQGDQLADAVVNDFLHLSPEERGLLNRGLINGSQSIPNAPESFRLFLANAEKSVRQFSDDAIKRNTAPYLIIGPAWMSISLGPGALVHTYLDPGIAKVLVRTKNLLGTLAARRLLETQFWTIQVSRPGGLAVGGAGYIATLQVRLMHARVRASLHGSSEFESKTPIDQRELVRTWLDFTVVSFRSLEKVGFIFSPKVMQKIYEIWQLIGQLLGINHKIIATVIDSASATSLLKIIDDLSGSPDENSRILTHVMLDVIGVRLSGIFQMPPGIGRLLADSFCSLFHGSEVAQKLGIEKNWTEALLPLFYQSNQFRLLQCDIDRAFKSKIESETLEAFKSIEKIIQNPAEFQKTIEILSENSTPRLHV